MKKSSWNLRNLISVFIFLFLIASLLSCPVSVAAETPIPAVDHSPTAPLGTPSAPAQPRYISGFGQDNAYTIFYEDRNVPCSGASRIYFNQTTTGPLGFAASGTATNICDTHFTVKDWPITIASTLYSYRAWGAGTNSGTHNFYVSNDLVNWNLVSTFTFDHPSDGILYGFHDIVKLNNHYIGWVESAGGNTYIASSDNGDDVWTVEAEVGGANALSAPLNLYFFAGITGPKPSGNFVLMELDGQKTFAKLYFAGNYSGAYMAINRLAAQATTPADAESAFKNPANWTWRDGTIGLPKTADTVIATTIGSGGHDVREGWTVPTSDYHANHISFYTADYASGAKGLGWMSPSPNTVWVDDGYNASGCTADGHTWGMDCFATIQNGIIAVASSGTVNVATGTYDIPSTLVLNKALTISGPGGGGAILRGISVSAASIFQIAASNVTLQNLDITVASIFPGYPTDEVLSSLIGVPNGQSLSGISILNNRLYLPAQSGSMTTWVARAITFGDNSATGATITGNTIYNTRNGIVIRGGTITITISNNVIYNTKGGIMNYAGQTDAALRTMSNNSWSTVHNEWDIVWNSFACYTPDYSQVLVLSAANNGAYVLDKRADTLPSCVATTGNRSHIFVNGTTGTLTSGSANGNMNLPYKTIQMGIDEVVPGGTVFVAAGTYPERLNVIKPLNLLGAGVGLSVVDGTSFSTQGSIMDITALTGNTTIQGFDIKTGDMSNGIHFAGGTDVGGKIEILDNHIISTDNYADGVDQFGIIGGYGDVRHLIISGNEISNTGDNSFLVERHMGATDITGNSLNGAYPTIFFMTYDGNNVIPLQKVSGNTIDMSTADPGTGGSGVAFWPSFTPGVTSLGRYADVEISDNTITGLGDRSFKGISVGESSPDCSGGFDSLKIFGNTISGTDGKGIQLYGHIAGADIHDNTITGLYQGIKAFSYLTTCLPEGNSISHNQISLASNMLVYWTGTSTFNVENNWWGNSTGPDPAKMSINVDYNPWCVNPACTSNQPPLPSSFWGYIKFYDGTPGPGSVLEAYIDGVTGAAAEVTIIDASPWSHYAFNVPGDLDGTSEKEGGKEGDLITFKFHGNDRVVATAYWQAGTNIHLDLHPPQAVPGVYNGLVGTTISLTGDANDWGSDATTYAWDLAGGTTYGTPDPASFSKSTVGSYTVGLKVTDAQGGVGTATTSVIVIDVAGLTGQVYDGTPKEVTVTGDPGTPVIAYTGADPTHTNAGSYAVSVTTSNGAVLTGLTMVINPKPVTVTPNSGQNKLAGSPDPVFTYTSSDPLATFSGLLSRDLGETPGAYLIRQGTLVGTGNFTIGSFVPVDFYIQGTCTINLVSGWNLVSLCLAQVDPATPGTVLTSLSGKYDLVYGWDGSVVTNNWLKFAPAGPPYANDMTRLDEKMGFWIHMTQAATLTVTGYPPSSTIIPLSTAGGSWNLVGYPSLTPMTLAGTLHDFTLIYAYHAADSTDPWKLFDIGAPDFVNDLASLTAKWGYWIKVTTSYSWTVTY